MSEEFRALRNPERAATSAKFFRCGEGQYGHGDQFLGIPNPEVHSVIKQHKSVVSLPRTADDEDLARVRAHWDAVEATMMGSPYNEERLLGLLFLQQAHQTALTAGASARKLLSEVEPTSTSKKRSRAAVERSDVDAWRQTLVERYLHLVGTQRVNNWNLVDASAYYVLGNEMVHCMDAAASMRLLTMLAQRKSLWERRVAIVSTMMFIREKNVAPTMAIAELLLKDTEDLIHKATGWLLREAGKKDPAALISFLDSHKDVMPRTMLRYAIEHLSASQRAHYLGK